MEQGARAAEMAKMILRTGHVTKSRAQLIAVTETARASSVLLQARATHVGSTHYYWRTSEDIDVRPIHKKLNGQVFPWSDPPVSGSNGERSHPGQIYRCRCWPEPIIPVEP
jgi:SPP1 gp7 family putative phage head morphogenesis protein